ncbi:putative Phosphate-specific transport system accessory protein PhoU [Candidatus Promineifilum breve]|uniref:Phosphate-specific transport system accessory protein PhoU n=1 Tax=Candidatus Promineifilum breve TaxID=1806508 RepID=A0A160T1F0_9CHLR|nr:PhoU domain-containing protein [Candidatus Promineifilum breve]CUS03302.2 putative Phosphate-specific transport system accessory protein PhoU [Candidatus Promineifilum breve]
MTHLGRALLDNELNDLSRSVLTLSSMVDAAIGQAVDSLMTGNVHLAETIILGDAEINRLRFQIEEKSYVILSTQQPLARDLRTVIAAIHFAIELERIGDHAAGIARIVTRMEGMPWPVIVEPPQPESAPADEEGADEADDEPVEAESPTLRLKLSRLPKMTKRARDMLRRATEAYIERDVDKANAIVKRDRKLNRHYRKFFTEAMAELSSQEVVELPTYLLWIAHNLERIGDRTTNLAERVVFMVTGQYTEVLEDYE